MTTKSITAIFFDFGGVVLTSPFDAFADYERKQSLPPGAIRSVNSTNPDRNAWARLERREISPTEFVSRFEAEANELGYDISGRSVLDCLRGDVRPAMVTAIRRLKEIGLTVACLTNNFTPHQPVDAEMADRRDIEIAAVLELFDHVIESAVIGIRKPEVGFYEHALKQTDVDPSNVVFLDDLGINLKPARALGMTTIKVGDPDAALTELERYVGIDLRD